MVRVRGVVTRLVLGAVLVAVLTACSPDAVPGAAPTDAPTAAAPSPADLTPAGPAQAVQVTLGIYSGRADPAWTLTSAEAAAVERAIGALPEASGSPPEGGLGYHGFTLTRGGSTITAYLGTIWAGGGTGAQVLRRDPGRSVEQLLLELGRANLTAAEIAEVERSLAAP
jgi:hypothetical protein